MRREGEFTGKDGQSVSTDTIRQGDRSVTKAEGSGGGSAISASGGLGDRTTIAQSGSGDLYAGHDGDVYRKTDDGWQKHQDGGWSDVDVPDRPEGGERPGNGGLDGTGAGDGNFSRDQLGTGTAGDRAASTEGTRYGGSGSLESRGSADAAGQRGTGTTTRAQQSNYSYEQLNRDAEARNGSYQNHQRRTSSSRNTGMSRGGGMRPRRR